MWGLENPAYSSIVDDHEPRSSLGVNFNWDSAIGPINVIYATILESEKPDTTDNLYFDINPFLASSGLFDFLINSITSSMLSRAIIYP